MQTILNKFTTDHLFDASAAMLSHLKIKFTPQTKTPIPFEDLYTGATNSPLTMSLSAVLKKVRESFFIGTIDEDSLAGRNSDFDLQQQAEGKYQTMLVFAVEINAGESLTRTELATLTRGFNRMASSLPIIVFIKNDNLLSLATCERSQYRQNWRDGEKLGKVAILRNINCIKAHRGHIDILESLGDKAYPTFDELYIHWLEVFSSELLTKKFYTELSEWYAWVIASGKVKFPNDINTTEDDAKYNHESVIRLITRLIFVWFLKQKNLIPKEFFDEKFIRENFIANFDPHSTNTLFYNPEQSKYYRLILQNLFFAMLNRPIMDEESGNDENRRFVTAHRFQGKSQDYNINNLLRYKSEFAPGGADLLLEIANSTVPFLNGGLFECLDDKDNGKYYDGFSERKASLEQLSFPDYFFFGDEVGSDVDLSAWYDDKKKVHTKVRGLIDILRRYNFTVEENTPLEQDVSLDPELLGKVFENLLASYNPETKATARKQTGSFYTPREIVQYMVDESLIEHLCRKCGIENKELYRDLFSYSTESTFFTDKEKDSIIEALHCCKILDPACGSGAFPMGILQQMVHALRKLDPTNERWKEFILKISLDKDKKAYQVENEIERNRLRSDIEQAFNRSVNDPDYARKLYLIENCIYGVDIQPIAVQISKLRFFISLVAEQKPTDCAKENFGIRPLPNLEAKFVAANSLVPLGEGNLFTDSEDIRKIKEKLADANHKLFIAKRNKDKRILRDLITSIRHEYANALVAIGAIDDDNAMKLAKWNMFDQNDFAHFFDSQWMFGLSDGFDIVIGNPPYIQLKKLKEKLIYKKIGYKTFDSTGDIYCLFYELATRLLTANGSAVYITSNKWLKSNYGASLRKYLVNNSNPKNIIDLGPGVFENAAVDTNIILWSKESYNRETDFSIIDGNKFDSLTIKPVSITLKAEDLWSIEIVIYKSIKDKVETIKTNLSNIGVSLEYGILTGANKTFILSYEKAMELISLDIKNKEIIKPMLRGQDIFRYYAVFDNVYLLCVHNGIKKEHISPINIERDYPTLIPYFNSFGDSFKERGEQGDTFYNLRNCAYINKFDSEKILYADIVQDKGKFYYDDQQYYSNDTAFLITGNNLLYLTGLLNSTAFAFLYKNFYCGSSLGKSGLRFKRDFLLRVPVPLAETKIAKEIENYVNKIRFAKKSNINSDTSFEETQIDKLVYHLYGLTYDEVLIIDPETPITREKYDSYE